MPERLKRTTDHDTPSTRVIAAKPVPNESKQLKNVPIEQRAKPPQQAKPKEMPLIKSVVQPTRKSAEKPLEKVFIGAWNAVKPESQGKAIMNVYDRFFQPKYKTPEEKKAAEKIRPIIEKRVGWAAIGAEAALITFGAVKGIQYLRRRRPSHMPPPGRWVLPPQLADGLNLEPDRPGGPPDIFDESPPPPPGGSLTREPESSGNRLQEPNVGLPESGMPHTARFEIKTVSEVSPDLTKIPLNVLMQIDDAAQSMTPKAVRQFISEVLTGGGKLWDEFIREGGRNAADTLDVQGRQVNLSFARYVWAKYRPTQQLDMTLPQSLMSLAYEMAPINTPERNSAFITEIEKRTGLKMGLLTQTLYKRAANYLDFLHMFQLDFSEDRAPLSWVKPS